MSELLVRTGEWNSINAGAVESFICSMGILLGLTSKRENYLNLVHRNIWGSCTPDKYYQQTVENMGKWDPATQLRYIMKECNAIEKKQLKIWYKELLLMEPMDESNIFIQMLLPPISNTIDTF